MSLKPFRTVPVDAKEWARWMAEQEVPVESEISITESQVSDLGDYVTTTTIKTGSGAPENVVTGSPPQLYLNTAGGAATTLYVKESGINTKTGWIAK